MKFNLQENNQSFTLFDAAMMIMAVFGLSAIWLGLAMGGAWRILSLAGALGVVWLAYGTFLANRRLRIRTEKKALVKEPKAWIKAVFIADLHAGGGKGRSWYRQAFDKINGLSPDVLLVGGDMVVADSGAVEALQDLKALEPRYGKYFVLGNHDYLDDPGEIKSKMESWGLKDLTNKEEELVYQGVKMILAGTDEAFFGVPQFMERKEKGIPRILLAHGPDSVLDIKEGQYDLVLCGHTHGGQIRVPICGSLVVPSKLGRRADEGWRVVNGVQTFVTRGVGEVMCRARSFCPPEIVVMEIGI